LDFESLTMDYARLGGFKERHIERVIALLHGIQPLSPGTPFNNST